MTVDGIKRSIRLHNLKKYTTYLVWVSASTSISEGPMSEKHTFSTAEDGKIILLLIFNSFFLNQGLSGMIVL